VLNASSPAPLAGPTPAGATSRPELHTPWGIVVCGSLHGDVVMASAEALAIVKAGLLVRALVIAGLEKLKRSVALGGGRMLTLEYGVYRVTRAV
jgi:hypothetical protein